MKELVVISGKGGTGKTSIVASFAALAGKKVLADCDVDAADLHIILAPDIVETHEFSGGKIARIRRDKCTGCDKCFQLCRYNAIIKENANDAGVFTYRVDKTSCEGCSVCQYFCPEKAIDFEPVINGHWFVSNTRFGPMVHAKLGIAEENSGKLVSLVRQASKKIAIDNNLDLIIIDGSPGIGCPVISSITGASYVLLVTEPSISARHDLERVIDLANHFKIKTGTCVNKWDINPELSEQIEKYAIENGSEPVGRIRYDQTVTDAQVARKSIVEYGHEGVSGDLLNLWNKVLSVIN
jgi:MinD superfamily P-loop ATPase